MLLDQCENSDGSQSVILQQSLTNAYSVFEKLRQPCQKYVTRAVRTGPISRLTRFAEDGPMVSFAVGAWIEHECQVYTYFAMDSEHRHGYRRVS